MRVCLRPCVCRLVVLTCVFYPCRLLGPPSGHRPLGTGAASGRNVAAVAHACIRSNPCMPGHGGACQASACATQLERRAREPPKNSMLCRPASALMAITGTSKMSQLRPRFAQGTRPPFSKSRVCMGGDKTTSDASRLYRRHPTNFIISSLCPAAAPYVLLESRRVQAPHGYSGSSLRAPRGKQTVRRQSGLFGA